MSQPFTFGSPQELHAWAATELIKHRPELLQHRKGRWSGPHAMTLPSAEIDETSSDIQVVAPSCYWQGPSGLVLMITPHIARDGSRWLHASLSAKHRDPTYRELTEVRDRFFRAQDTVVHVWPPRDEHISIHDHCLHLWCHLDGSRCLPDLRPHGGGL